jgi:SAM-dependent methyltransferase
MSYFARLAALETGHFWFEARNRVILWALAHYFPHAQNFCEVGCGTGFVLSAVQRAFPQLALSGSEVLVEGLSFARQRLPTAQLYQMDALDIPFVNMFDVLGVFDVLEHIEDDAGAAAQLYAALKPGGGLLVTVPQHPELWSAFDVFSHHYRRYTRASMTTLLEGAGFVIERTTSLFAATLPALLLTRRNSHHAEYDPWADFKVHPLVNRTLNGILSGEAALIRAGISFPLGSTRFVVARKPGG